MTSSLVRVPRQIGKRRTGIEIGKEISIKNIGKDTTDAETRIGIEIGAIETGIMTRTGGKKKRKRKRKEEKTRNGKRKRKRVIERGREIGLKRMRGRRGERRRGKEAEEAERTLTTILLIIPTTATTTITTWTKRRTRKRERGW